MFLRRRIYRLLAISMDDSEGLVYQKITYISHGLLKKKGRLIFYLMSKCEYQQNLDLLAGYGVISTSGIKDIIFQDSGKVDLYHLNKDRSSTSALNDIDDKASFVVSAYDGSRLASLLSARKLAVSGSAAILGFGIKSLPYIPTDEV